jgi:hypothetical protein
MLKNQWFFMVLGGLQELQQQMIPLRRVIVLRESEATFEADQ